MTNQENVDSFYESIEYLFENELSDKTLSFSNIFTNIEIYHEEGFWYVRLLGHIDKTESFMSLKNACAYARAHIDKNF